MFPALIIVKTGYLTPSDIPVGTMFANLDPANGLSGRTVTLVCAPLSYELLPNSAA
jgi:hypothetical protein